MHLKLKKNKENNKAANRKAADVLCAIWERLCFFLIQPLLFVYFCQLINCGKAFLLRKDAFRGAKLRKYSCELLVVESLKFSKDISSF